MGYRGIQSRTATTNSCTGTTYSEWAGECKQNVEPVPTCATRNFWQRGDADLNGYASCTYVRVRECKVNGVIVSSTILSEEPGIPRPLGSSGQSSCIFP